MKESDVIKNIVRNNSIIESGKALNLQDVLLKAAKSRAQMKR